MARAIIMAKVLFYKLIYPQKLLTWDWPRPRSIQLGRLLTKWWLKWVHKFHADRIDVLNSNGRWDPPLNLVTIGSVFLGDVFVQIKINSTTSLKYVFQIIIAIRSWWLIKVHYNLAVHCTTWVWINSTQVHNNFTRFLDDEQWLSSTE